MRRDWRTLDQPNGGVPTPRRFASHALAVFQRCATELEPTGKICRASGAPGPLLDRMEVVPLDGYTEAEKVAIARDHLAAPAA
jgi:hypothetical protein